MIPQFHYPGMLVIVLAAGKGTRMRSRTPKVLHKVLGRSMLEYVLHTIEALHPKGIAVVVGHGEEKIREHIGDPLGLDWVVQEQQLGTAHAVKHCESVYQGAEHVLIVCGDTPMLGCETLTRLLDAHIDSGASVSVLSASLDNPVGYGRILRSKEGECLGIVEEKDASNAEREIQEISSGIFCVRGSDLFDLLKVVGNDNTQGEYYLPDIIKIALGRGLSVQAVQTEDATCIIGINDRVQLARVEAELQRRLIEDWQIRGVTIEQPETVRIEATVRIGADCLIKGGSQLTGSTHLGDDCTVGPNTIISDSWLDDQVEVFALSHIEGASIGSGSRVGPFARLRPAAELDEDVHIGNFVEIKKSVVGRGSKINHLSYIGDSSMGSGCNIGAGTITCNYDGANKHQTVVGNRVFVGSDTKFIAPVKVGDDSTIGAGSIISRNVAEGGLTLSVRGEQKHVPGWERPSKKQS